MSLDISSLWKTFEEETTKFSSIQEASNFIELEYNLTPEEAIELILIAKLACDAYFGNKRFCFLKKKEKEIHSRCASVFINGVFFGLFLSKRLGWNWHVVKKHYKK